MENCIFCLIISGDIPAEILYSDEKVLAFRDVNAQAPEHFLVIPKEHIATANDATDEAIMGRLMITAANVAKELGFVPQLGIEDAVRDLCMAFSAGKLPNSLTDNYYFNVKRMQEIGLR